MPTVAAKQAKSYIARVRRMPPFGAKRRSKRYAVQQRAFPESAQIPRKTTDYSRPADYGPIANVVQAASLGRGAAEDTMDNRPPAARGSGFFSISAILIAALVVLSFPLTYFIPLATGSKSFTMLRHLHGLAFFSWIILYVVQTQLVRTGHVRLHRELGIASVALAGAMLPLGLWQAVASAGERQAAGSARPFEFSLYNLIDILVFSIAFGWAVYEATRRIEWHRRLMFVAALNLFGPAFSRWILKAPIAFPWLDMSPNLVADALLIALMVHDRGKIGRIHPVTMWAALTLIPFHAVEPLIARSVWWNAAAPGLFGFW